MNAAELEVHLEDRPPPALHYGRTDLKSLGEDLAALAQLSFNKGQREATYECEGQWFRYRAGGAPFEVNVTAFTKNGEKRFFRLFNNGDGLAFEFGRLRDLTPAAKVALQGAKDGAVIIPFRI